MIRIADLCCGCGGCGAGYMTSGMRFYGRLVEVVGVDNVDQPDYPFEFHQDDALRFIREHGKEFDLIHASPPCQSHSALTKGTNKGRQYADILGETREALKETGRPYVIENVMGAPMRADLVLCGEMFGLGVIRHRQFELGGWSAKAPEHKPHRGRVRGWRHGVYYAGPYHAVHGCGGGKGTVAEWQQAMRIHWTDRRQSIAQAVPPAYTQYIGSEFLKLMGEQ